MRAFIVLVSLAVVCSASPQFQSKTLMKLLQKAKSTRGLEGDELTMAVMSVYTVLGQQCEMYRHYTGKSDEDMLANLMNGNVNEHTPTMEKACPILHLISGEIKHMERPDAAIAISSLVEEGICASILGQIEARNYLVSHGKFDDSKRDEDFVQLETETVDLCKEEFGKNDIDKVLEELADVTIPREGSN